MLSKPFRDASISMYGSDAYTISNIVATIYGRRRDYAYENATRKHMVSKYLVLWYSSDVPQSVPAFMDGKKFPYTIKELLAYLYDKIGSN